MKIFFILFLVAGLFLVPGFFDANALSCALPNLADSIKESEIVFSGKVISVENTLNYNDNLVPTKTLFSVTEPFKGIYESQVTVHSDETWGPWFEKDKEYLIFADSRNNQINAQLCSPIDLVENSDIGLVRELSKNFALPPLQQIQMGALPEDIICRNNYQLVFKFDNSPACVRPTTAEKLLDRGWAVKAEQTIPKPTEPKTPSEINYQSTVNANNQFAFDFYSTIKDDNENIFYSPWSIMTAFAIANEGARQDTAGQMQDVFGFSPDASKRQGEFKKVNDSLNQKDSSYSLQVANALWLAERFEPFEEYVDAATKYYDSEVSTVDFVGPQGVDKVNKWVAEKTNNKIKDILEPGSTDELTRLVITNAIYFKGTWVTQFEEDHTEDRDFFVTPGSPVKTPMMNLFESEQVYGETEKIKILELPYEGDKLSMLLLLPKEIDGIDDLENSLTVGNLSWWRESLSPHPVQTLSIPKFELETEYPLIAPLRELGIVDAFNPEEADFSGIMDSEPLYISSALHKAFVDVNEEGTEAAAVTAIGVSTTSAEPEPVPVFTFVADHPFVFLIQDDSTGNILFIGKMADPAE